MSCKLFLDRGPHLSGRGIHGRLECSFHESVKIRGIKLRVFGEEHTEWIDTEQRYDENTKRYETVSVPCIGDNSLIDFEIMLFGGRGETHLGPGNFTYSFSFLLPPNLPSSFSNSYGYIRYGAKGIVDVPWGIDYTDKIYFEVDSPIDLNTFPIECFQPVSRSDSKTVCCWCCAQGDITLEININKTAFVPGEKIKLFMTVTNMSNSNVEEVSAKFMQYLKSKVESPKHDHKENQYEFGQSTWSGVGAHGDNRYDMEIYIPPDSPFPNLNRSTLFEISYDVEICATIGGCHSDMELSFSVEIGQIQHHSQIEGNTPPSGVIIAPQPTAPNTGAHDAGYPYPQVPQTSQFPGAPGIAKPPDYKSMYPGGPPDSGSPMNQKEKEAINEGQQAPSAPPSTEELPPSYEDAYKSERK